MNTLKNKKLINSLKLLAYYEIIGGLIGLAILIYLILITSSIQLPLIVFLAIGTPLFALSIISGQQLLKENPRRGLNLSTATQYLQIISFAIHGYSFMFVSGFMLSAGIDMTDSLKMSGSFSLSELRINYNLHNELLFFKLNIVAVIILIVIGKIKSELKVDALADK